MPTKRCPSVEKTGAHEFTALEQSVVQDMTGAQNDAGYWVLRFRYRCFFCGRLEARD